MDLIIKNGTVVTSKEVKPADILIKNGKIESIKKIGNQVKEKSGIKIIDAEKMLVMPGGVDVHTHLEMPFMGTYSTDDFLTGTIAAAMGGTTSIIDYIIPEKGESLKKAVNKWHKKADNKAVIDYGFHMAIVPPVDKVLEEFDYLVKSGITSIKCFLAYKDSLMLNDTDIYKLLVKAREHKILVCVHAENGEIIDYLTKKFLKDEKKEPVYHAYSRPPELEDEAVSRIIKLSRLSGTPVYFVHLSSKGGIKEIKRAKKNRQRVFAETCPQYAIFSEHKYFSGEFEGAKFVMSPPLRKYKHCSYIKKSIKEGFIDVIATDHCPFNFNKEKQRGIRDFTKIPNGMPGIEARMPVMFNEMVVKMGIDLSKFVELNCTNPAKIFGMKSKGDIKEGKDADIAIWNPDLIWKITKETLHENVDYTPYEDYVVTGKPITVISRGKIIMENCKLKAVSRRGKFISREISKPAYYTVPKKPNN